MGRNLFCKLAALAILVTMIQGCNAREEFPLMGKGKVTVRFALQGMKATRALDERQVADVNIYVANMSGDVVFHHYSQQVSDLSVDIWEGHTFTIYAVANAGKPLPAASVTQIMQLEHSAANIGEAPLPMSGVYGPARLDGGERIVVPLVRCAAKVELKCSFSDLNDDVSIKVKKVMLKNVPATGKFFAQGKAMNSEDVTDGASVFVPDGSAVQDGLSFYMLENMQGTLQPDNRIQKDKVWPEGSLYSQICSYVEILAQYESDKKEGDIVYRFYLGKDAYANYDVERNTKYTVSVSFKGNGGVDENSWRVDVDDLDDVVPPRVEFVKQEAVMYDLEEIQLPFSAVEGKWELKVVSSDPSVVQVIGFDKGGVEVRALSPGKAEITATVGAATAVCSIDVEKLRIVPSSSSCTLYNHFYEDISYEVYPPHASSLGVVLTTSSTGLVSGYNGIPERVIPQFPDGQKLPLTETILLQIEGREDVTASIDAVVNPILQMSEAIVVNANLGSSTMVKDLGLKCAPRAQLYFYWEGNDRVSIYGDPEENVIVDGKSGTVSFPVPNGANGLYRLVARVMGDDGYGRNSAIDVEAVKYCDITIYETVYLVGVSKTMGKDRISANPEIWRYTNEVVAKWLSHPKSLLYPNGEVDVDYGFVYNGVTYEHSHTEIQEEFRFTFVKGDYIDYVLDGPREYKGTPPEYFLNYFYLQPAVSPYINGNMREGTKFLYITSLQFARGFADDTPAWEKIFNFIYY